MTMTPGTTLDEMKNEFEESPGLKFAKLREQRGLSQEYVAGKLHLRVRIIELLEADDYESLPEPVFIKGYMRGYAKLLNIPYEPLLSYYNRLNIADRKVEKALWQGKRETNPKEKMVRWFSLTAVLVIIIAAGFWWQKNNESSLGKDETANPKMTATDLKPKEKLMTLSKIQSMFAVKDDSNTLGKKSG